MESEQLALGGEPTMDAPGPNNLNCYRKLFDVLAEVGRIEKDKHNEQQNYNYLSEQAIKQHLQPLLVKHKLLWVPLDCELLRMDEKAGREAGKSQYISTIKLVYRWVDIETGQFIDCAVIGCGSDALDKGPYKAFTGALKYAMTGTFVIPTGDDPEKGDTASRDRNKPQRASEEGGGTSGGTRNKQNPDAIISEPQQKRMFALMHKANKTPDAVRAILAKHGYDGSKTVRAKDYEAICAEIEKA